MSKTYRNKPLPVSEWTVGEWKTQYFKRNNGFLGHKVSEGKARVFNNGCPCCNRLTLAAKKKITSKFYRRKANDEINAYLFDN